METIEARRNGPTKKGIYMRRAKAVNKFLVSIIVLSIAQASCAAPDDTSVGSFVVPLLTETNGIRYRLPDGAYLEITNDDYFYQTVDLSGDETLETVQLPAGEFDVTLLHDDVTDIVWPLTRIDIDDSESTVDAELVSSNPADIVIVGDETSSLVLHFELSSLENVTFQNGSLDVTLDVDPPFGSQDTSTIDSEVYQPNAPVDLPSVLIMNGQTYVHSVDMSATDSWYSSKTSKVCIHLATDHYTIDASDGLALLLAEVTADGGTGRICIEDPEDPLEPNEIQISQYRTGPATTSLASTLTGESYLFYVSWIADLPTDALEVGSSETILDLDPLRQQTVIEAGTLRNYIFDAVSEPFENLYYSSGALSEFTIQFAP